MSTGIDGKITAGQGKLDQYGYFEYPCKKCAKEIILKINNGS